jgi:hypothetical protein
MQLGQFEVTCSALQLAGGQYYGRASVVWHEGNATLDEIWDFDRKHFDTPAEAIAFAQQRVAEIHARGGLGAKK